MSILSDDIFDKLITIGDRYTISILRVNCPAYIDFVPANEIEKTFPFRGVGFENTHIGIKAIEDQIRKEVLEAPITKVQGTTQRYAHIKRCIKKHVNFDAYRCTWETSHGWGRTWREPKTVHVVCKYRYQGEWRDLIRVTISLINYDNEPF